MLLIVLAIVAVLVLFIVVFWSTGYIARVRDEWQRKFHGPRPG